MNQIVEVGSSRDAVEDMIERLLRLFKPQLNPGVTISQWAETMVLAIGDHHAPNDIKAAGERLIRAWKIATFPLPAEIRDEIARAKQMREWAADNEVWKRTVQWHDDENRTMYAFISPLLPEAEAMRAELKRILDKAGSDETSDVERLRLLDEGARLFFECYQQLRPGDPVPEKYRSARQ